MTSRDGGTDDTLVATDPQDAAHRRAEIQAWHLRQLLPR